VSASVAQKAMFAGAIPKFMEIAPLTLAWLV
jgi:hypothetical protein